MVMRGITIVVKESGCVDLALENRSQQGAAIGVVNTDV